MLRQSSLSESSETLEGISIRDNFKKLIQGPVLIRSRVEINSLLCFIRGENIYTATLYGL